MQIIRNQQNDIVALRLDPGEEIISTLTEMARQENLSGALVYGIGTVKNTVLGYYDLPHREYHKRNFPGDMELVSFLGNIMWFDGEPFCHAHVTISGLDFISHSGHLFQADIAVTGEFFLQPLPRIERVFDEQTGLKQIK